MEAFDRTVSVQEYLGLDLEFDGRLELLNGVVVAMAGASLRHNRIVMNVSVGLSNALRGGPCLVLSQDQRVHVAETRSYVYPDIVVVCDPPELDESGRPFSLKNPSLVVEVLSPSTLDHDLGAKLGHYRQMPSVQEVLFVHTEARAVTLVSRQEDGSWKLVDIGPEGEVVVAGVTLSLDAIYDRALELPG